MINSVFFALHKAKPLHVAHSILVLYEHMVLQSEEVLAKKLEHHENNQENACLSVELVECCV